MGAALSSDTAVVDCDSADAFSTFNGMGKVPETLTTLTPRGIHIWLQVPEELKIRNRVGIIEKVDVRTAGGYVVVPPSVGYEFEDILAPIAPAPSWVLELLTSKSTLPPKKQPKRLKMPWGDLTPFEMDIARRGWERRINGATVPDGRSPASLKIAMEPWNVAEGTRNAALFSYLCRLRSAGRAEDCIRSEAYRTNARIPGPLNKFEVEKVVGNVLRFDAGQIGRSTLVSAWRAVEKVGIESGDSRWYRFLLLVEELADRQAGSVLLPVRQIGALMGVSFKEVSKWRDRAIHAGFIKRTSKYVRRQLADEFQVLDGFSPLIDGPARYKVKRGRKPKLLQAA